jgi:predicted transcriptional regulator
MEDSIAGNPQNFKPQTNDNPNGDGPHVDLDATLRQLVDDAAVEAADLLSAGKVRALIAQIATYDGYAKQAGLDALRALYSHLDADAREAIKPDLHKLFEQAKQVDSFLASCPRSPGENRFEPYNLAQLMLRPAKEWYIDQLFGPGDIGTIFGPPGCGKTFIVIDLIFAACLGRLFARRFDVARPLNIVYCAGEGLSGLPARFAAAAQHYGVTDDLPLPNFTFFELVPQLFDKSSPYSITQFVTEYKARIANGQAQPLDLLIIDTQHAATVGARENDSMDMGEVTEAAKQAIRELGGAVMLIHHTNKAGTGERGSSSLRAAMDFMIELKPTAGKYAMNCYKVKHSAAWKPQTFDLVAMGDSVRVWWDEPSEVDGDGRKSETARELLQLLGSVDGRKLTSKQISDATGSKPQTVNKVIARLEKDKLLERSQNERGTWCFTITQEGEDVLRSGKPI